MFWFANMVKVLIGILSVIQDKRVNMFPPPFFLTSK